MYDFIIYSMWAWLEIVLIEKFQNKYVTPPKLVGQLSNNSYN